MSETRIDVTLTVAEAAQWFKVARSTVRMWAKSGLITAVGVRDKAKLYPFSQLAEADRRTARAPTQPGRRT